MNDKRFKSRHSKSCKDDKHEDCIAMFCECHCHGQFTRDRGNVNG